MSQLPRPRLARALSGGVLAALTLGLTAGVATTAQAAPTTATYSDDATIAIPRYPTTDAPVETPINVPSDSGVSRVGDLTITLHSVKHDAIDHLYVWMTSAAGTDVDLLCGAPVAGFTSGSDLTFATDGPNQTNCNGPYDAPLQDVAGDDPAGPWVLHAIDDASGVDPGEITGGWTVAFNQYVDPAVTTQPQDANVGYGNTATFTATATGNPRPLVQWQRSTDGGVNWTDIPGADKTSYTTGALQQSNEGNLYRAEFYTGWDLIDTQSATVHMFRAPSSPMPMSATQTAEHQLTITWTLPSDTGSGPILGYHVVATAGDLRAEKTVGPDARSTVLDVPAAGPTYAVNVAAVYPGGDGETGFAAGNTRPTIQLLQYPTTATYGRYVYFRGKGLPGEDFGIYQSVLGGPWTRVAKNSTNYADGTYTAGFKPTSTASFRVQGRSGIPGPSVTITVKQAMTMAAKRVSKRKYTFYGTVSPVKASTPVKVYYRKSSGAYGYLGATKTTSTGKWSYTRKFTASKTMVFKAVVSATNLNASTYKTLRVAVR